MADLDRAGLERRLRAGGDDAWLTPAEVAAVLKVSKGTVHYRISRGRIGWKPKGGGSYRLCDPADVLSMLEESLRVRRAGDG